MQAGAEKPVWRLAFFSRLEERKGLKLFVEAVGALDQAALDARFEVHFVGAESRIDMMASGDWLKERTASWTFPVRAPGGAVWWSCAAGPGMCLGDHLTSAAASKVVCHGRCTSA